MLLNYIFFLPSFNLKHSQVFVTSSQNKHRNVCFQQPDYKQQKGDKLLSFYFMLLTARAPRTDHLPFRRKPEESCADGLTELCGPRTSAPGHSTVAAPHRAFGYQRYQPVLPTQSQKERRANASRRVFQAAAVTVPKRT